MDAVNLVTLTREDITRLYKEMVSDKIVSPLFDGKEYYEDYGVCKETNEIYSKRRGGVWKPLTATIDKSGYAKTGLITTFGEKVSKLTHRLVYFTLSSSKSPRPSDICKFDWENTPESIKNLISSELYEVNHVDHNRSNYKIYNLELVTRSENIKKYQIHRKSKKVD
jgi:hypothetical protein